MSFFWCYLEWWGDFKIIRPRKLTRLYLLYSENRKIVFERQLNQPGITVLSDISCSGTTEPGFYNWREVLGNIDNLCRSRATNELRRPQLTLLSTRWRPIPLRNFCAKLRWLVICWDCYWTTMCYRNPTRIYRPYIRGFFLLGNFKR